MKKSIFCCMAVLSLSMVFYTGCQTSGWEEEDGAMEENAGSEGVEPLPPVEEGLPLAVEQRFKDIPLPVDVKQDTERTYVFESHDLQVGRMVYSSKAEVRDLAQFFIRECPTAGWELQSVMQADVTELLFSKPGKRLEVRVLPQTGVTRSQTLIINLTPEVKSGNLK